jgi:hypothetical protein
VRHMLNFCLGHVKEKEEEEEEEGREEGGVF